MSESRYPGVLFRRPTPLRLAMAAALSVAVPTLCVLWAPVAQAAGTTSRPSTMPRLGDRGDAVRTLQRALISAGLTLRGGADGIFGQSTLVAVQAFQTSKGLVASGTIDATTAFLLGLGPSPTLPKRGDRGPAVSTLQVALTAAGQTPRGGADGVFGAATTTAVSAFQTVRGLPASGVVDIATAIALGIVPGSTAAPTPIVPSTSMPTPTVPTPTSAPSTAPVALPPSGDIVVPAGQRGDAVVRLQRALIAAGVQVRGGADGIYGAATTDAVTTYQRLVSIATTGTVDTLTAQFLGLVAAPALPAFGQRGAAVTDLQNRLIAAGITVKGGADGSFGVATRISVRNFQTARRIPVTGVVDLRTAVQLGIVPGLVVALPTTTTPTSSTPAPTTAANSTPANTAPAVTTITVFPVLGPCWFSDTWMAPRAGGRRHEGVDIIARTGQPLYAVVDGTITRQFFDRPGSLGGNALRLTAADGTYFHYAHLSAFAEGVGLDSRVVAGQVIGYVGSTGSSSAPHLHFEYHPGGGAAVNPFPIVKAVDGCRSATPPTTTPASSTVPESTASTAPES